MFSVKLFSREVVRGGSSLYPRSQSVYSRQLDINIPIHPLYVTSPKGNRGLRYKTKYCETFLSLIFIKTSSVISVKYSIRITNVNSSSLKNQIRTVVKDPCIIVSGSLNVYLRLETALLIKNTRNIFISEIKVSSTVSN
jgi:hypothetical protein